MSKSRSSPQSLIHHLSQSKSQPSSSSIPLPSKNKSRHRPLLDPKTNPIPLLPTRFSRTYTNIHTLLVVTYYFVVRRNALIRDPLTTMLSDIPVLTVLQSIFVAGCVPRYGEWSSIIGASAGSRTSKKKGSGSGAKMGGDIGGTSTGGINDLKNRIIPTLLSLLLTLLLPPIPLTVIALCLGAPLYPTSSIPLTALLSIHLSLLAFLPVFYTHGVSADAWRDVSCAWLPFDEAGVWGGVIGGFVGGWVGAVPIALDWDRDWQNWPCTVVWGMVAGWALGRVITGGLKFGVGRRVDLSENVVDYDYDEEDSDGRGVDGKINEKIRDEQKKRM